jgi:hypothetical protein
VSSLSAGDMHPINGPNHKLLVWIVHPCHVAIHPSNDIDAYLLVFLKKITYLFIYLYVGFKFSVVVVFGVVVDEGSTP